MELIFKNFFDKHLKKTPSSTQAAVAKIIIVLEEATSLQTSGLNYKKIEGQSKGEHFYRIRVGDWRIGIEYIHPNIIMICVLSRGTIYKQFPPGK